MKEIVDRFVLNAAIFFLMKTVYVLLLLSLIASCNSNNKYSISGSFKEKQGEEWIYLINPWITDNLIDSAKIVSGKFEFSGSVEIPEIYYLSYHPKAAQDAFGFFLEPSELDITIDPSDWTDGSIVSGGPINDEFFRMEAELANAFSTRSFEICDVYSLVKEENREIYNQLMQNLRDSIMMIKKDYIWNNPDSPISLIYLNKYYHVLTLIELDDILNRIPEPAHHTWVYERITEYYDLRINQKDTQESITNTNDVLVMNELSLDTSIIGALVSQNPNKVLYIDIWGTGCGPCRKEFPYSHRLHERIDTNKVVFIYLCIASEEDKWKVLIEEENLQGQHYLLDRELVRALYEEIGGQRYNPRYVIINKSGEIENSVAPWPSSPEIEQLLTDLSS